MVWWRGASFFPPPCKYLWNFATLKNYIFLSFQQITFKLSNFTKLKALFPAYFLWLVLVKSWKNRGKVHYDKYSVNTNCHSTNTTVIYNDTELYELLFASVFWLRRIQLFSALKFRSTLRPFVFVPLNFFKLCAFSIIKTRLVGRVIN